MSIKVLGVSIVILIYLTPLLCFVGFAITKGETVWSSFELFKLRAQSTSMVYSMVGCALGPGTCPQVTGNCETFHLSGGTHTHHMRPFDASVCGAWGPCGTPTQGGHTEEHAPLGLVGLPFRDDKYFGSVVVCTCY